MSLILTIIIVVVAIAIYYVNSKPAPCGNFLLISGGVKTGKTQLGVRQTFKLYRRQMRKYRFKKILAKIRKQAEPERPLIYSNVPIGRPGRDSYVPLTLELLTRDARFAFGSVIYFCEGSLLAGSKDIKNENLNDLMLQLFKLVAHETHGGYLIIDTQAPQDLHYTIKRSLSTYYHIFKRHDFFFFAILDVREMILMDGEKSEQIINDDPQDARGGGLRRCYWHLIGRKWFKYYDRYAFSSLTDDLPCVCNAVTVTKNRKVNDLVRMRNYLEVLRNEKK